MHAASNSQIMGSICRECMNWLNEHHEYNVSLFG